MDLREITEAFTILFVGSETIIRAYQSNISDFEDAIQEQCAKLNDVDLIITSNKKLIKQSIVKAMTLEDFLQVQGG